MYSVVLATMLAAGGTTPAWHHHHHRGYAHGCYSSCYAGYGWGCYGGYSCFACSQPACHCSHFRHHHHHVSYGWYGGGCYCSGYYCSGYYCGGCYSSGCYCSGYYSNGCYCSGIVNYGCHACCGGVVISGSPRVVEVPPANSEVEALRREVDRLREQLKKGEKVPAPKEEEISTPATKTSRVTVNVPSDARVWVDGVECPLTSSVRSFDTPPLNANQRFSYTIRMEVVRNGQAVSESQRVVIVPGEEVRVDFTNPRSVASR